MRLTRSEVVKKLFIGLVGGCLCLLMLQALAFTWLWISFSSGKITPGTQKSDLIIVFPGDKERIKEGHALAKAGHSENLLVIGHTQKTYAKIIEQLGPLPGVNLIEDGKSRSTFEDAYIAKKIIVENRFQSVVLVTSSYHMPRVLFLARMFLADTGLNIDLQYHPVEFVAKSGKWQRYCNELIKFWGSATEMIGHKATGTLLLDLPLFADIKLFLSQRLYFRN